MRLEDRGQHLWATFTADMQRYTGTAVRPWSLRFLRRLLGEMYMHPALMAVAVYRYGQWIEFRCRVPVLRQLLNLSYYMVFMWVRCHLQVEVPRTTAIDAGLRIDHFGGTIINCQVIAGKNLWVKPGVVIGQTDSGVPEIGDNVEIGVGAKVLGGIRVGSNVIIGAQAAVVHDVPDGAVVAGVPARVLRIREVAQRAGEIHEKDRVCDTADQDR